MKKWKLRFKRFEGFYKRGELRESLVDSVLENDGSEILCSWIDHLKSKYGKIDQPNLEEDFT